MSGAEAGAGAGAGAGKLVAVTGASGYIASWLVKLLLENGYTVKASVRNPNDSEKVEHLLSLDGAKERLHLFQADLLKEGSFDALVDGCDGVFHTASPVMLTSTNPQAELLEPAINGTLNVLRSCAKVKSIKRVVLTSSVAAVSYNRELKEDVVVDESWFSDPSYCEENMLWYVLSKTLAEEAAWKFAKEHEIDMVVINPGFVIGPLLHSTALSSINIFLDFVKGDAYPHAYFTFVDVRDVANGHIIAFEILSANGRYCLGGSPLHSSEAINILRELYPTLHLADKLQDDQRYAVIATKFTISNARAKSLGVKFTPLKVALKDTLDSLLEKNLLPY